MIFESKGPGLYNVIFFVAVESSDTILKSSSYVLIEDIVDGLTTSIIGNAPSP